MDRLDLERVERVHLWRDIAVDLERYWTWRECCGGGIVDLERVLLDLERYWAWRECGDLARECGESGDRESGPSERRESGPAESVRGRGLEGLRVGA